MFDFRGLPLTIRPAVVPNELEFSKMWQITKVAVLPPEESHGLHHVYIRCFRGGQRVIGVSVEVSWPDGVLVATTEEKPLTEWGDCNFPLYGNRWDPVNGPGPYDVGVADGEPSELLQGMGLPLNQHFAFVVEFEEVDVVQDGPEPDNWLKMALLAAGEQHQVIRLNPAAALQNKILADEFIPTSEEFPVAYAGVSYVCQRAERLDNGDVRIYYVVVGQWSNVMYVSRDTLETE